MGEKNQILIIEINNTTINIGRYKLDFNKSTIYKDKTTNIVEPTKQTKYFFACNPPVNFLKITKVENIKKLSFNIPVKKATKLVTNRQIKPCTNILIAYSYISSSFLQIILFLTKNDEHIL